MKKNTDDGAKIYTPLTLKLYDWRQGWTTLGSRGGN
ncbi:hypothetical protein ACX3V1_08270, partial [Escherichia coli]